MNMNKKFLLIITLVLAAAVFCPAQAKPEGKKVPRTAINALINDYRHHDEFESINLGKFMTYLVKKAGAISLYDDDMDGQEMEEARLAFNAMKSIKGITVADYEDCSPKVRRDFNRKMSRLLDGVELLMSAKDDDESVYIYGYVSGDGTKVKDLVIFAPDGGSLICLYGTIDMDNVGKLVNAAK